MREILFKAKLIENGEWVEGYLDNREDCKILTSSKCPTLDITSYFNYKVDKKTVSQYTGLKDKNGVKIFEGDSLKRTINMRNYSECDGEVVEYHNVFYSDFQFYPFGETSDYMEEFEVVGNIHDEEAKNDML